MRHGHQPFGEDIEGWSEWLAQERRMIRRRFLYHMLAAAIVLAGLVEILIQGA